MTRRSELRRRARASQQVQLVQVVAGQGSTLAPVESTAAGIVLELRSGVRMRLHRGFDSELLRQVVAALETH